MVNENLPKEELEKRVNWYSKKYGPYIDKRGLNNWKNLFRKPTLLEWTILVMLLMGIFMAFAYQMDNASCGEVMANPCLYCNTFLNPVQDSAPINIDELWINKGDEFVNGSEG